MTDDTRPFFEHEGSRLTPSSSRGARESGDSVRLLSRGGHHHPGVVSASLSPEAPLIPHASRCKRPAPVLRLSWAGTPEAFCPGCGRYTPATDTRTERNTR